MRTNVALDFKSGLGDASFAQFAATVLSRVSGNPKFSALQPFVSAELQPAYDRFAFALQEAADGGRTKVAIKRAQRMALTDLLEIMAAHLQTMPDNSETLILESGFHPRRRVFRSSDPEQVQGLRASNGEHSGEVILEFEHPDTARSYGIEWSSDGGQQWQNGTYSTARRAVLHGLPTYQNVQFRVYAIATQQRKGAVSVPASLYVL